MTSCIYYTRHKKYWFDHFLFISIEPIQIDGELLSARMTRILPMCTYALETITCLLRKVFLSVFLWRWLKKVPKHTRTKRALIAYGIHQCAALRSKSMQRWRVHTMTWHVLFLILYFMEWFDWPQYQRLRSGFDRVYKSVNSLKR